MTGVVPETPSAFVMFGSWKLPFLDDLSPWLTAGQQSATFSPVHEMRTRLLLTPFRTPGIRSRLPHSSPHGIAELGGRGPGRIHRHQSCLLSHAHVHPRGGASAHTFLRPTFQKVSTHVKPPGSRRDSLGCAPNGTILQASPKKKREHRGLGPQYFWGPWKRGS
jgi:hypothetical protein